MPATSYFAYPNRSRAEAGRDPQPRAAHDQQHLGRAGDPSAGPARPNGTIRIATWTFKDMAVAKALVNARTRGVSVQVVAAKSANEGVPAWRWLKKQFGSKLYRPGHPETRDGQLRPRVPRLLPWRWGHRPLEVLPVHQRRPAPRAQHRDPELDEPDADGLPGPVEPGRGDPHAGDLGAVHGDLPPDADRPPGARHLPHLRRRSHHQLVLPAPRRPGVQRPRHAPAQQGLVHGCDAGGTANGHTKIRIINYSIYGPRGVWIAKKLRRLWNTAATSWSSTRSAAGP